MPHNRRAESPRRAFVCPSAPYSGISGHTKTFALLERHSCDGDDGFVVFDGGEGVIEVVQRCLPAVVTIRLAEIDRVVFECLPFDGQEISILGLETPFKIKAQESRCGAYQRHRAGERQFECILLVSPHVEYCDLTNHVASVCESAHFAEAISFFVCP